MTIKTSSKGLKGAACAVRTAACTAEDPGAAGGTTVGRTDSVATRHAAPAPSTRRETFVVASKRHPASSRKPAGMCPGLSAVCPQRVGELLTGILK